MEPSRIADGQGWVTQARALLQARRWAEAIEAYRRAIALGAAQAIDYLGFGVAYEQVGDLLQAEIAYREALTRDDHLAAAYRRLGSLLQRTGRADQASSYLRAWADLSSHGDGRPIPPLEARPVAWSRVEYRPYVTYALLLINVGVFAAMTLTGGSTSDQVLLQFGAISRPAIAEGQYWRLLAAMFIHIGPIHLLLNGMALYIFGLEAERLFGRFTYLMLYLIAGLYASLAVFAFGDNALTAGASGAIFGLTGAMIAALFLVRHQAGSLATGRLRWLGSVILINLLFTFSIPGISILGHVGGLVSGLILGWLLAPRHFSAQGMALLNQESPFTPRRLLTIAGSCALFPILLIAAIQLRPVQPGLVTTLGDPMVLHAVDANLDKTDLDAILI